MLLLNRVDYTAGYLVYLAISSAALWRYLDHGAIAGWAVAGLGVTLMLGNTLLGPGARWLDARGLPVLFRPSGWIVGLHAGSLFWIDTEGLARSSTAQSLCLGTVLAMSTVVQSPTVVGTLHPVRVHIPMMLATAAGLAALHDLPSAAGVAVMAVLILTDAVRGRRIVLDGVRARMAAEQASVRDPLTGLDNRTGLLRALEQETSTRGERDDGGASELTVMYIDLDRFKQVNDRFGHAAGDQVLCQAAERLRACFRAQDVVARLGGDEFVVLLRTCPDDGPTALGERVIDVLERPFCVLGREAMLSASVGIATSPRGTEPAVMLANADRALFKAKQDGRRRVLSYDAALGSAVEARTTMEMALRRAVRDGEIIPHGQPVFCLRTGRVVSVELLARWVDGGRHVSPAEFIALAEEVGLIRDLGRQMMAHAVRIGHEWAGVPALRDARVAVNISPLHVVHGLLSDLAEALGAGLLDPSRLVIEITEQHALPDEDGTKEVLEAVRARGVQVAIDDFGSGFASIRWLTSLPVTLVKLDRSLLVDAARATTSPPAGDRGADGEGSAEFLQTVGLLARTMSRTAVAEGIETREDLDRVCRAGIPLGQGYLLARPMPLAELALRAGQLTQDAGRLLAELSASPHSPAT